jgi:cytochrome d ubiquinol oxidase subunit I
MLDPVFLSRLQFALTIMFHYLFPPLTIGLGGVIVVLEAQYLKTRRPIYEVAARFWTRIFAVNFALGVATGIVMEFEFGTNWANYSRFVGDVFGSALASEGIFAFFLESGFLAVLVFGWDRVSAGMHFFAALMVAVGSAFSAVWIVVANSWQQTPAGFHLVTRNGHPRAEITDFTAMVFSPSSMIRLAHTLNGAFILGAFCVMSISAWYILHQQHQDFARRSFQTALIFAAVFTTLAVVTGDRHAKEVAQYQPTKLAAMEGEFETNPDGAAIHLFGIPDQEARQVRLSVEIPGGLSFLVHGNSREPVPGLDQTPASDWPPVLPTFAAFHLMVGLGFGFLGLVFCSLWFLMRGTLFAKRWLMWVYVFAALGPYVANEAGWATAEIGRQPWSVYRLLRTSESVSPTLRGGTVLTSIILFGFVYLLLFAVWIYVMNDKVQHGPEPVHPAKHTTGSGLLAAAAQLEDPSGESLTSSHSTADPTGRA